MELLVDISLLGTCTALVHYAFGAVGLGLLVVTLALVEHRSELQWLTPTSTKRMLTSRRRTMVKRFDRQATWRARMVVNDNDDTASADEHDALTQRQDIRRVLEAAASVESDDDDLDVSSVASESALTVSSPTAAAARAQLSRLVVRDLGHCNGAILNEDVQQEEQSSATSRERKPQAHRRVTMNSRAPIPFETDLFVGHIYFLVRTTPEDPHWRHLFTGKRRRFWIQVQGRFKRAPTGVVYLGGELPSQISLGLFTKSIALVIMGIIQKLVGKVSYCFGDSTDSQLPFVSFPLYQSVDQFVMTPAGEQPPPLGREDFGETEEQRRRRRMTPVGAERFEVGPTYSFHFHTMYVNLTHWKTANLPGMSDMKLTTFFDSLPLRIVAYDILATTSDPHVQTRKKYLFCFEVEHEEHRQHSDASTRQSHSVPRLWRSDSVGSLESSSSNETGVSGTTYDSSPCPTVIPEDNIVTSDQSTPNALRTTASHESVSDTVVKTNAAALVMIEKLRLLFWFEEVDGTEATRRVFYAFQFEQHGALCVAVVSAYKLRLLFGKYRELDRLYDLQRLRFHARSRIGAYSIIDEEATQVAIDLDRLLQVTRQTWETTEADLRVLTFSSALYECMTSRLHLLAAKQVETTMHEDAVTPASIGVTLSRRDRDEMDVVYEGVVYRFCAPTIARQEVLVVTSSQLLFYRSFSSRAEKTIDNSRVIGVQAVPMPHVPASSSTDFGFALQISTFAEEVTICVSLESARNEWIRVVLQHCCPHTNFERALQGIGEPWVVCYTPLKALQPANRVVLNSRSLFPRVGRDDNSRSPIAMVTASLRAALSIHCQHDTTHADVMAVLEFLNLASALRTVDLDELLERPHEERMVFFLNLYHAVLAHAIISHGYPRNKAQWEAFQLRMCYAVGFDTTHDAVKVPITMSLAEIEHIILRGRLPRPPSGLPHLRLDRIPAEQLVRLSRFALAHPDFRLAFALLMNQDSQDTNVVVYEADQVHQQLNDTMQRYINQRVRVDLARQCIVLPRLCDWYRLDYGGGGAPMYCVRKLLGFLEETVQQEVMTFMESPGRVQVKYDVFSYTPRAYLQSQETSTATSRRSTAHGH